MFTLHLGFRIHIDTVFPSDVGIERYGVNGLISPTYWNDNIAGVICRQNGYTGGVSFLEFTWLEERIPILLATSCNGTEALLSECREISSLVFNARRQQRVAQVICFLGSGMTCQSVKADIKIFMFRLLIFRHVPA